MKLRIGISFCFFLLSFAVLAQPEVDSIDALIKKGGHDTALFNHHVNAAKWLYSNEPKKSREYLNKALKLANKLRSELRRAEVYHVYAITYYFESDLDKSLEYNLKSLEIRKSLKDKRGMCRSYGNIGLIYELRGDISSSLWYHNASLRIEEELNNKMGIAQSLGNIGNLYMHLADFDRALLYQFRTIKILTELNDPGELATTNGNISNIYQHLQKYDKATEYAHKSLKLSRPLNDWHSLALTLSNLAVLKREIKEYDSASIYADESLMWYQKVGSKEGEARARQIIGDIKRELGKLKEADEEYNKALTLFREVGSPDGAAGSYIGMALSSQHRYDFNKAIQYSNLALQQVEGRGYLETQVGAYELLYISLEKSGKLREALEAQRQFFMLNDSLKRNKGLLEIQKQELQQSYEQRAMRDSLQIMRNDARIAETESSLQRQSIVRYALIIGIVLVAGFLVIVFNRLRVIRKQKQEIEREKKIREEQHKLLEEKNTEILDSINYAWRIQHGMMPSAGKVSEIFPDSFVLHLPKDKLSGDFYWVGRVHSQALGELKIFAVADCTGHGIPGALVSITGINYLKLGEQHPAVNSPAQALDFVNKGFYDLFDESSNLNVRDGMDASMCALQTGDLLLHYASAKNSIHIVRAGELIELESDKHPIGRFGPDEPVPFTPRSYQLKKGDMVYIFSDGYGDQFGGPRGRKYKSGELKKLLLEISEKPCTAQHETLLSKFKEWKGSYEQTDDVTVMGIRV